MRHVATKAPVRFKEWLVRDNPTNVRFPRYTGDLPTEALTLPGLLPEKE